MKSVDREIIVYGVIWAFIYLALIGFSSFLYNHFLPAATLKYKSFMWLRTILYIGLAVMWAVPFGQLVLKECRDRHEAKEEAYWRRHGLREATRRFVVFMEDRYGWLREMPEAEQKQLALRSFDQITTTWEDENWTFHDLAKCDDWQGVLGDLGQTATEMLELWQRRRVLYQYAIAFSTEATRAAELLKVQRQIQLQKVDAARERAQAERAFLPHLEHMSTEDSDGDA